MNRTSLRTGLRRIALAASCAVVSLSSCVDSRYEPGRATYYVELEDRVVDPYGAVQAAFCSGYVELDGDVDTWCAARPMVWSYGQSLALDCSYRDADGAIRTYWDFFWFDPGYVREPNCDRHYVNAALTDEDASVP